MNALRNRHSEFKERELDLRENLVQEGLRTFGRVEVVVNNAGIMPIAPPLSRRIALLTCKYPVIDPILFCLAIKASKPVI